MSKPVFPSTDLPARSRIIPTSRSSHRFLPPELRRATSVPFHLRVLVLVPRSAVPPVVRAERAERGRSSRVAGKEMHHQALLTSARSAPPLDGVGLAIESGLSACDAVLSPRVRPRTHATVLML